MRRIPAAALLAGASALLAAGCAWVEVSEAGQGVRVASAAELRDCDKIGATHAKTAERAWIFARSERKIADELTALARNEAAAMGGDAVAPRGPASEGRRSYDVYRCGGS